MPIMLPKFELTSPLPPRTHNYTLYHAEGLTTLGVAIDYSMHCYSYWAQTL